MFHTAMLSIKQLSRTPITTILFQVHFSCYYIWFLFDVQSLQYRPLGIPIFNEYLIDLAK